MHKRYLASWGSLFLLCSLVLAFIPPSRAMEPLKAAKVGEWVEYQVTGGEEGHTIRDSIVGKEGNLVWYETKTSGGRQVTIMKVLIDPNTGKVKRAIVKNPPERAMEIPLNMVDRMTERPGQKASAKEKPIVTTETIQVPAGTFKCTHVRDSKSPTSDGVWSSEKVPVRGMVKTKSEKYEMVLTAFGHSGAQTEITETPKKMPTAKEMIRQEMKREFDPRHPSDDEEEE